MVFETQSTRLDLQAALEGARQAGVGAPGGAWCVAQGWQTNYDKTLRSYLFFPWGPVKYSCGSNLDTTNLGFVEAPKCWL